MDGKSLLQTAPRRAEDTSQQSSDRPWVGPRSTGSEPIEIDGGPLLTTKQVADLLKVDQSTLRRWRTSSPLQGPPFVRVSDRVYKYRLRDVEAWLASRRTDPGNAA